MSCKNINGSLTNDNIFNKEEELLFELLFGTNNNISIVLDDYCTYKYREKFKTKIRTIAKLGGVKILDDRILHNTEKLVWKIEVRK